MTNKSTKRNLTMSVISMLLCVVMLVGLTFAWFTDSVTNKGNRIQAGNLKIDLLMDKDGNGNYTTIADGTGDIFSEDGNGANWEPGKTEIVYLAVQNKGNLALNYNILLDVADEGLASALEYAVLDGKKADDLASVDSWTALKAQAGDQTGDMTAGEITAAPNGTLDEVLNGTKDETEYFALAVHMKETAGNEYKDGSVTIDVNVVAKQAMAESDSFGNDYDKDAAFPVASQSQFEDALENAQPGDKIKLSEGTFDMTGGDVSVPAGVSIIGQEGTKIALNSGNPNDQSTAGMLIGDDVTIANVEITGRSMGSSDYNAYVRIKGDNVVLDNVTIDALYTTVSPIRIDNTDADNVITIKNSNIYSTNGRAVYIVDGANGTVNIENTEITGVYPISVNSSSSQELVLNVKDSKLHGWISYGDIESASFTNTEFSKGDSRFEFIRPYENTTFTDCTFAEGFKIGAGAAGKTYTVNNCTSAGTKVTASNVQELLLDMTGTDGDTLPSCTIVVDGVSVTPKK